jgi:hypothetical protein
MAMLLFLAARRPDPPPFVVLSQPVQMPVTLTDRLLRWAPRGWVWLWRLEASVLGPRKRVAIFADIVSLSDSSEATLASFSLGKPSFSHTNGLQVWMLGAVKLKELKARLDPTHGAEMFGHPAVTTASGMEAQLFQGQKVSLGNGPAWAGINLRCCGLVRPDSTDLVACFLLSEFVTNEVLASIQSPEVGSISIQTNLDAAVRLQVPKGNGFFLLDVSSHNSAGKHFGVIINLPSAGK